MLSVEEALERILARVPVLGAETVALGAARGRVLAQAVAATADVPPWAASSMDGYAVRARDVAGAAPDRPVALRLATAVAAGEWPSRETGAGEAARILTGAPLPPGADAVVPQEEVGRQEDRVIVSRPVAAGACVRPRGEDIRAGEAVLSPGTVLGPAALGVLATLGCPVVRVVQRPRVAVLSTGDEVADLGEPLGPGRIPNANTYSLAAQVEEAGGVPLTLGVARDSREDLRERFRWALGAHAVVSSAGVSVGDRDLVREVAADLGAELDFWQVSMRPGKPVTFGLLQGRPFFGLPGNPVSSMVTFELFVRPALRRMGGHPGLHRPRVRAVAGSALDNPGSRRGYLRVVLRREGERLLATPTGDQGSGILRSMLLADGLAILPPGSRVEAGAPVEVILLRREGD
jgi:molybdopterin molybdotransferase